MLYMARPTPPVDRAMSAPPAVMVAGSGREVAGTHKDPAEL